MSEVSPRLLARFTDVASRRLRRLLADSGLLALAAMLGVVPMTHPSLEQPSATGGAVRHGPVLQRLLRRWDAFTQARWGLAAPQVARVLVLLAAGLAVSLGSAAYLFEARSRALQAELFARAEEHVKLLRASTLRSLEALHAIAAFMESGGSEPPSREAFQDFVRGSLQRLPEVRAFEWIPVVPAERRAELEQRTQREGYPEFVFTELDAQGHTRPASQRDRYFPVYYVTPESTNLPALGLDLGAHPARLAALRDAEQSDAAAATSSIRLAQETEEGQVGFLVFVRVMDRSQEPATLRGFALAVFRVLDVAQPALAGAVRDGLDVRIRDRSDPEHVLFSAGDRAPRTGPTHTAQLDVFGRTWDLSFLANASFGSNASAYNVYAYPVAGLFLTLLIAGNTARSMRRTLEIESRVEERTAELSHEVRIRRDTEAALRVTEAKYRSIFENAIVGIFQTTPEGSYLDANPALARIYGYDSREDFMTTVRDVSTQLYARGQDRARFIERIQREGSVHEFVSQVVRKDGTLIWISETAVSVRDPDGNLLYYEGSVQDVTERVLAEQSERRSRETLEERVRERTRELAEANRQLQAEVTIRKKAQEDAAQARQAQASFLASMSHEIRTPLNVILGYSQVLQQQLSPQAPEREALEAMLQSGQHLLTLVGDVVDLSKIEAGRVELSLGDFNLGSLISSVSFMFRKKCEDKGLKLKVEGLGASAWWVRGDEVKLRQVLINLLGNAVKFTERGEVRLRVVPEENARVRFEVIDTGIGIPAHAHDMIFERFARRPAGTPVEGAGLGLAISGRLVEVMGGVLEVRSSPGWGSNFHFSLRFEAPLAVRPSETNAFSPRIRISPETPCRVLIVDDLEANRKVLAQLLTTLGCHVEVAESGSAALSVAASTPIDIVLLDVLMPGMDGIQTARELRRAHGDGLKLAASSASVLGTQGEAYLAAGFDDFIPKPFRTEQLTDCLASLLKVRFVTDDSEAPLPPVPGGLDIPEALLVELREAAELYQVTLLRGALMRLEQRGPREQAFAERLKGRATVYDMPGILQLLEQARRQSPECRS